MKDAISKEDAKKKGIKWYFTGDPCSKGHVSKRYVNGGGCFDCKSEWMAANKNRVNLKRKQRYQGQKEVHSVRMSNYYKENKSAIAETNAIYRKENKDRINKRRRAYKKENKKAISAAMRRYCRKNPAHTFTRCTLRRIETASQGGPRLSSTETSLGYTQDEFKSHIESLWLDGMSWDNRGEWHIDHIKPLSLFIKEGVTDIRIINALGNLQPLWAKDNISKGAKYEQID